MSAIYGKETRLPTAFSEWRLFEQSELFDGSNRLFWRLLENDLPAAGETGCDVLRTVVQVEDFGPAAARGTFDDFIDFFIRFHRAVLIGKDVAVEVGEEREIAADVAYCQLVR